MVLKPVADARSADLAPHLGRPPLPAGAGLAEAGGVRLGGELLAVVGQAGEQQPAAGVAGGELLPVAGELRGELLVRGISTVGTGSVIQASPTNGAVVARAGIGRAGWREPVDVVLGMALPSCCGG
jgi:hypothetical protein